MIIGAHTIIYSVDPDTDRAFFRDVLKFPNVDVGGGWLMFGMPPSEVAFHPSESNGKHEFYLMVTSIEEFSAHLAKHDVPCSPIQEERWGRLIEMTLPGGGVVGAYEPLHERAPSVASVALG